MSFGIGPVFFEVGSHGIDLFQIMMVHVTSFILKPSWKGGLRRAGVSKVTDIISETTESVYIL